jgi:hypothetical protein
MSRDILISIFYFINDPLIIDHWAMCCSPSNCLHIFYYCFCCWALVLMHCNQIECTGLFLFSYTWWSLLCNLRRFHVLLIIMYFVQNLDEIFCRHWLSLFDLWCDLDLGFVYWVFVWMTYLLVIWGFKVSYYHCVGVYICFQVLQSVIDEIGCI